jgi:hypothetical protein
MILKVNKTINIEKGIIFSDPSYSKDFRFRYENSNKMENYQLYIGIEESNVPDSQPILTILLLDKTAKEHISPSGKLDYDSVLYKTKEYSVGTDTNKLLIKSKDNNSAQIINVNEVGTVGFLTEFRRPIKKNGKTYYQYCGFMFNVYFKKVINNLNKLAN